MRRSGFIVQLGLKIALAGAAGSVISLAMLWMGGFDLPTRLTLTLLILLIWIGFTAASLNQVISALHTISNLLAALREGDYVVRARQSRAPDALQEAHQEFNQLAETLHAQRLDAWDATTLLRRVMAEIEVAIFAFDDRRRLRLVNRAGENLLNRPAEHLLGETAARLGLDLCLDSEPSATRDMSFSGGAGRFGVRRSEFRLGGIPHQLLVLSNLSRPLREEERQAWQRLIRTLSHELNNSLAPIKSIAESLSTLLEREPLPEDWSNDAHRGLAVIRSRAEALNRFMQSYSRLARLPQPQTLVLPAIVCLNRAVGLETRIFISLIPGPDAYVQADPDQLEQALINLLRNAVEASAETGGVVRAGWKLVPEGVEYYVEDEGPGLANPDNLFVPFYTTKPGGSGIGLILSRQIAEAHGGRLTLENRPLQGGCLARLLIPSASIT